MEDQVLVMSSIKEIAERDGLTRAAISKAVKRLLSLSPETPVERGPQGEVRRISLAHYDHHREKVLARVMTPGVRAMEFGTSAKRDPAESFEEARRQNEWLKVSREKLQAGVDAGRLIDRQQVERRTTEMGKAIAAIIARLPNAADDVALSISIDGLDGVRRALRVTAARMCLEIEKIFTLSTASDEHR